MTLKLRMHRSLKHDKRFSKQRGLVFYHEPSLLTANLNNYFSCRVMLVL